MPYIVASILRANEVFARVDGFEPDALLAAIDGAPTLLDGAERLELFSVLDADNAEVLREFFTAVPPALDAAILAGLRSALSRGVRVQFSWQPGYEFELRAWERSEGSFGVANFHILSPEPPEVAPVSTT